MKLPPAYVLYCSELPEREQQVRQHFLEHSIPARWWRGFHGKTWGLDTTKEYDAGQRISPGHVGLNLGSWAMWQHAYQQAERPDDEILLFEDDAVLPPLFHAKLTDLRIELNYTLPDWDLVFLGLAETEPHVWHKVTERLGKPNSGLCRLNEPFGTHAMMVRARALRVLIDHMTVAERNLDQQLWQRVLQPGLLKWCAVLPSIVRQRTFDYDGKGKPEWRASTVDLDESGRPLPSNACPASEHELKQLFGDDHRQEQANSKPTPEYVAATAQLIDPFPCIFRGEFVEENAISVAGRMAPMATCARLNVPCYMRRGFVAVEPENARRCETCQLRLEMGGDKPRERLPLPDGHFNPSMIRYRGELILATRDSWGHSKVALWKLRNDKPDWTGAWACEPIGSFASEHKMAPRLEDPRLFTRRDPESGEERLCAMFNLPDGYPPKYVQVGYAQFDRDLTRIEYTDVFISPHGNAYEKNWVPFANEYGLNWVYATKPRHVVLTESGRYETTNPLPWTGGFVRGGATPVLVRGTSDVEIGVKLPDDAILGERPAYYHFFHGCHKRVQGSVYTVGCVVFDAKPPYKVLRQTAVPLIWPDLPYKDEDVVKRYVVWPGGAVPHAGAWHLAIGVDDTNCRIVRLPFELVEAALNNVPETVAAPTLRDTTIATGSMG